VSVEEREETVEGGKGVMPLRTIKKPMINPMIASGRGRNSLLLVKVLMVRIFPFLCGTLLSVSPAVACAGY
jgi:hypothetical protein